MNANKGKSFISEGGLIGSAVKQTQFAPTPEPSQAAQAQEESKKAEINNMAEKIRSSLDSGFDTPKKRGRKKAKTHYITTSARFQEDLYDKMSDFEESNFVNKTVQYNTALKFWFKNGCPLKFDD